MPISEQDKNSTSTTIRPWIGRAPRSSIPVVDGYVLTSHEKLRIGQASLIGLALIPLWFIVFYAAMTIFGGPTSYDGHLSALRIVIFIAVVAFVIVAHEALHGLVAIAFGSKPSFGIGPGFFYMTFFEPMGRNAYFAVGIAPFVVISIASVFLAIVWPPLAGWALVGSLFNISGAGGDVWMAGRIARHPPDSIFFDLADGFAALVPTTTRTPTEN